MKSTKHFKMHQSFKRLLATVLDPHRRGHLRRSLIQAQLQSQFQPPRNRDRNKEQQT